MVYLILSLLFALLIAAFAVQNSYEVVISFFAWELTASFALIVIAATIAGALIVGLIAFFRNVGSGLRLRDERSRAKKAAQELEQARLAATEMRSEIDRLTEQSRKLTSRIQEMDAARGTAATTPQPALAPATAAMEPVKSPGQEPGPKPPTKGGLA